MCPEAHPVPEKPAQDSAMVQGLPAHMSPAPEQVQRKPSWNFLGNRAHFSDRRTDGQTGQWTLGRAALPGALSLGFPVKFPPGSLLSKPGASQQAHCPDGLGAGPHSASPGPRAPAHLTYSRCAGRKAGRRRGRRSAGSPRNGKRQLSLRIAAVAVVNGGCVPKPCCARPSPSLIPSDFSITDPVPVVTVRPVGRAERNTRHCGHGSGKQATPHTCHWHEMGNGLPT